jgi:hypothetical protein
MDVRIRCLPGAVALLAVLASGLAGCGGDSDRPAATPATPTAPTATPTAPGSTPTAPGSTASGALTEQITSLYQRFFDGTAPVQTKVNLLQRGPEFVQVMQQQAAGPLARSSGVKVTKVVRSTENSAAVTFSVLLDGKPVLPDQHGGAVFEDGVWKISASTYCALLSLQQLTAPPCQGG